MFDEYFYYTAHQEEIIKGHLNEYVSIMGNKVLGYYKDQWDGLRATRNQYPDAEGYFIRQCRPVGESDEVALVNSENLTVRREWTR
jgi:hypothetical protein